MRKSIMTVWAAICSVWASTASTLWVHATEQGSDPAGSASGLMLTMDVFQKVCIVIVIAIVVLLLLFYAAKMILRLLRVPTEEGKNDTQQNK